MDASLLSLDFPAWPAAEHPCAPPPGLAEAVGSAPAECFSIPEMHGGDYYLFMYATEAEVAALAPNIDGMKANVLATARRPISPISPLYLPYISPISPLYLPYISLYLPISPGGAAGRGGGERGAPPRRTQGLPDRTLL